MRGDQLPRPLGGFRGQRAGGVLLPGAAAEEGRTPELIGAGERPGALAAQVVTADADLDDVVHQGFSGVDRLRAAEAADHADGVGVEDGLGEAVVLYPVDEPECQEALGPGQNRGQAGHHPLRPSLQIAALGVGGHAASHAQQSVAFVHLDAHHVDERYLGSAAQVQTAAHLGRRHTHAADESASRRGELEENHGAQQLRHVDDRAPERAHRPCRAHLGHRKDEDGNAGARHRHVRFGHLLVVLQRRDGTARHRVDRPFVQRGACDGLQHADERLDLIGEAHFVLHVLGAVLERDERKLQARGEWIQLERRYGGPHEVDLVQGVEQPRHAAQVLCAALASRSGLVVEPVRGRAVRGADKAAGAHHAIA